MTEQRQTGASAGAEAGRDNPWITLDSRTRYENPWVRVVHNRVLTPAGSPGIYGVVQFLNRAVGVVPVDADGSTWLVGQFRYPLGRYSWEIPEGGAPEGQSPEAAALRELAEETGLVAGHLLEIGRADLSNSVTDEVGFAYVAWGLRAGEPAPEETERLEVRRLPLGEALAMVLDGRITDSLSQLALMRLRLLADTGTLPPDLAAAVAKGLA